MNKINWNFNNTYFNLPSVFRENVKPTPVKKPELVLFNKDLSSDLNLDFSKVSNKELSELFSGNSLPEGSNSIAQAYAGHQFGHFTMLGDGRAVLIGEHLSKDNKRYDIQFKGSGKTTFSRNGDGRAALGPMLREYIISEAMNSLKIPTTRSFESILTSPLDVEERISTFAISCAEKLRIQNSSCNSLMVFIRSDPFKKEKRYNNSCIVHLSNASNSNITLSKQAIYGLRKIFKPGISYKKAGVLALGLTSKESHQLNFFVKTSSMLNKLMVQVDVRSSPHSRKPA